MKNATLSFHSFDGGGPNFSAAVEDAALLTWTQTKEYEKKDHEELTGAGFTVTFTFTGLKPGKTQLTVEERSPIAGNWDHTYAVTVEEDLRVTLEEITERNTDAPEAIDPVPVLAIGTDSHVFYAVLEDNSSAAAFVEQLSKGEITLELQDYGGFEKVGALPWALPGNDESITAEPGDIISYQGNQITICYDENSRNLTRLARIGNVTKEELLAAFGPADTTVSFWIEWSE